MPALPKDMVAIAIKTGASTRAQVETAPLFKAGDKVIARNINPPTHTRLPRYIRGKHGVVQHNHGGFAFADRARTGSVISRIASTACASRLASYGAMSRAARCSISICGSPISNQRREHDGTRNDPTQFHRCGHAAPRA